MSEFAVSTVPGPGGCFALKADGSPCRAKAGDQRFCNLHRRSAEDLSTFQSVAGIRRHARPAEEPVPAREVARQVLTPRNLELAVEGISAGLRARLPGTSEPNVPMVALAIQSAAQLANVDPEWLLGQLEERRVIRREDPEVRAALLEVKRAEDALVLAAQTGQVSREEIPAHLLHRVSPELAFRR